MLIPLRHISRLGCVKNRLVILSYITVLAVSGGIVLRSGIFDHEVEIGKHQIDTGPITDANSVWSQNQIDPGPSANKRQRHKPAPDPSQSEETQTPFETFSALLNSHDYELAVDVYDQIYTDSSIEISAKYRELLLDEASKLIQGDDLPQAIALLNQYLAIYYKDVDALIMLGRAYRDIGSKFEAIKSLQQAYQHEHRTARSTLILSQENTMIGTYIQELRDSNSQQTIIDVYRWLTQSQPDVPGYYIGLANAYIDQQRYVEAIKALRYVQYDIKVGPRARSLLNELLNNKITPNNG